MNEESAVVLKDNGLFIKLIELKKLIGKETKGLFSYYGSYKK